MKGIEEIRCENLKAIIGERFNGIAAHAAQSLGFKKPGLIYRLLNPDRKTGKPKPIGPKLARKIETVMGKPLNWLDTPHYRAAAQGSARCRATRGRGAAAGAAAAHADHPVPHAALAPQ